ncbi:MAG: hypothetical protein AAF431_04970 [Pseudomonadota bacterium]
MAERITYFHIGYARAASTFLQKSVFPALTGLQYIPRNRFRVREREKKRFKADKILMSRESGKHIFTRADDVKRVFGSRIIISLRRQDTLAASNYRLHAKKGHTVRFDKFLDLENDQGTWKLEQFEYMRLIRYIEESTGEKPIVLIFEDYIANPDAYLDTLCAALECGIDKSQVGREVVHKSYSDKQLRLRRQFADFFNGNDPSKNIHKDKTPQGDSVINFIRYRVLLWSSAIFMRLANLAPDSWLSDEPLIEPARLEQIKEYYKDDWQACNDYVAEQNRALGL